MSIKVIGKCTTVVEVPGHIKINEVVGGVSTSSDDISVACVKAGAGTSEPWLTMDYCEWLCILSGQCVAKTRKDSDEGVVTINAGETAFIQRGSTWQPTFPVECEYIAICRPAFRPDRCIREDENNAEGMEKLKAMHKKQKTAGIPAAPREKDDDLLYHMTTRASWEEACAKDEAYYPPTFAADGNYTHATAVPARLLTTANHFYQDSEGEWICLEFTRSAMKKIGIFVRDEEPLPVGDKDISADWSAWQCPHVYGGIPPCVVQAIHVMERDEAGRGFVSVPTLGYTA
jgi:hypothetical protein